MNYRQDIQGLRGIAVLLVLFYHLYPKKISGGFIGVDIFFVISGFLVCYSIENRIKNQQNTFYITFYAARLRRLLPASLLTLSMLSFYIYKFDFTYFSIYKNDAIACLFIYANYNFYFNKIDYFHAGLKESPLLHYWSLSLEEQFYIIAPFFVWILFSHVVELYIILAICSLTVCIFFGYTDKSKGYFFLSSRSWEFILGALIRYMPKNTKHNILLNSNISTILIIVISIYYNDKIIYPSYYALLPVILSLYTLHSSQIDSIINNYIICMIGNLSYSIYLIHFPLKSILTESILLYLVVLIICSILSYYFIELPVYKGSLVLSDRLTYLISIAVIIFVYKIIIDLKKKSNRKLKTIKHYSTAELIGEFINHQRNYCCLNENSKVYKSSILFIGDSHIEQYIIGLFNNKYNYLFHMLHIYVNTFSYNSIVIKEYIKKIIQKYSFNLCIIGNLIESNSIYLDIYELSIRILSMCRKVLISNDNPRLTIDPNSCLKKDKNDCYGEVNKTCIFPKPFKKPNNNRIDVVTFWDDKIIKNGRCMSYYNYLPIYADSNHLSKFYLQIIIPRVTKIISKYIGNDKEYKYDNNCPYYHIPHSHFVYNNLQNKYCN